MITQKEINALHTNAKTIPKIQKMMDRVFEGSDLKSIGTQGITDFFWSGFVNSYYFSIQDLLCAQPDFTFSYDYEDKDFKSMNFARIELSKKIVKNHIFLLDLLINYFKRYDQEIYIYLNNYKEQLAIEKECKQISAIITATAPTAKRINKI